MRRLTLLLMVCLSWPVLAGDVADWPARLEARLVALEAGFDGELGVHVRPLGEQARFGWRDEEDWYLASLVKIPVAVELLARAEAGELTLDEQLVLRERDYVDGAGPTNWAEPGTALTLRELLVPMLTVSDNTATDMLIERLGLEAVNRRARSLVANPEALGPITPLVEVRREAYGQLHPGAHSLTGMDFILLRQVEEDEARLDALAETLGEPRSALELPSLDAAFAAYYASGLNAGRLDAFAELLAAIGEGRALGPAATGELLAIMSATTSGEDRLKAGLGPDIRFAHKTGTQHRRSCDAGIAAYGEGAGERRVVVVACTRGERKVEPAERLLYDIGRAIRESGVSEQGDADDRQARSCKKKANQCQQPVASHQRQPEQR